MGTTALLVCLSCQGGAQATCVVLYTLLPRPRGWLKPEAPCAPACPSATEYDEAGKYALAIDDAHRAASAAAMELLRRRENLAGGLGVLKRYFLTAQVGGRSAACSRGAHAYLLYGGLQGG